MNPEEVQIELAEKFELPCNCQLYLDDCCPACESLEMGERCAERCPCHGSGVQHPLRKACDGWNSEASVVCLQCQATPQIWSCGGTGHIYNDSPGVLTDAIREKGWYVHLMQMDDGDYVEIHAGETRKIIAAVEADQGLQFPAALELAALRAVEATAIRRLSESSLEPQ